MVTMTQQEVSGSALPIGEQLRRQVAWSYFEQEL